MRPVFGLLLWVVKMRHESLNFEEEEEKEEEDEEDEEDEELRLRSTIGIASRKYTFSLWRYFFQKL